MAILALMIFAAVVLTGTMFASQRANLGWPSAIFWGLAGGQAYSLRVTTWDIYGLIGFACLAGMFLFIPLAALGMRKDVGDEVVERKLQKEEDKTADDEGKDDGYDDGVDAWKDEDPASKHRAESKRVNHRKK